MVIVLRQEPKTRQQWDFKGWSGTPQSLAMTVRKIRDLMPNATFKATVTSRRGDELIADEPEALAEISVESGVKSVDVEMSEFGKNEEGRTTLDTIRLRFGASLRGGSITCETSSSLTSRSIIELAKDAIDPGRPAFARWKHDRGWKTAIVVGASYVIAIGVGVFVAALFDDFYIGFLVAALFGVFCFVPAAYLDDHFLPAFELYDSRPFRRRFAWQLFAIILAPLVVGLIAIALTD